MIEYDLKMEKMCTICYGAGFLVADFKLYSTRLNPYEIDCVHCEGRGFIPLPELELEEE